MKYISPFIFFLWISITAYNQDTTYYYNSAFGISSDQENARYKRELIKKSDRKSDITTYIMENGQWKKVKKDIITQVNNSILPPPLYF